MKSITSHLQGAAERARTTLAEHPSSAARAAALELRIVPGGTQDAAAPGWASASRVEISERGRALIAHMAERTVEPWTLEEPSELASEAELAEFLADGIAEGFLD